jgi:two-component system cell cycle sensor histidine kinase/response regulator CckA
MNVLIVEDNSNARKLLRYTFEHYHCTVIEAQDGQEGLDLAARHRPDVIVSDALMPRMDGFQLLRALKADPVLKSIPFIFYSSTYTGDKEAELALSLGAEAFVAKPAEPEELWEKTCAIMKAWDERQRTPAHPSIDESDEQYLREYSRVVAAKLEEKVHELEEALALRTQAEEQLRGLNEELTREIAERKRAEATLKEQEQELATIFENAPFVMLLLDGERRVRRVNGLACSFTGSPSADMINRRNGEALQCIHALDSNEGCGFGPDCQMCAIRLAAVDTYESGTPHHQEEARITISAEGKEQTTLFLLSTTRVTVGNQPMVLLSLQDISEHRKLEEQLRQAQKMESIGTLAGGIAHDFNNILTIILGYGQMTLMNMTPDNPLRIDIEQMLAAAERASHLTRDLLLFSRKQISDKKSVDLNEIIRTVEKFLVRIIGEDINCTTRLADGVLPVFADDHQLEQVLVNLATNARDAMPKGGAFAVATDRTRLGDAFIAAHGYGSPGMYVVISVTDTGSGMNEGIRQHIFDPFFTTKEVGKGTGLGMAVVYGIIKQHDGYINVYSEPGKGTTFRIYLPIISTVADAEMLKSEVEQPMMGTEAILFAEDDESVRRMTVSILQNFGYEVIVAVDGEDAVNTFLENRERIKLLLFDLVMPKKTGKEAYDEIRQIKPDIKVIFVSGYAPEIIQQKEMVDGNMSITCKPFSPTDLLKKVRRALDSDGA